MEVGDVIDVQGGYPFLLAKKNGCVWTWVNLSSGDAFDIEYQHVEMNDTHDHEHDFLRPRGKS